jgi:hypothetical protein
MPRCYRELVNQSESDWSGLSLSAALVRRKRSGDLTEAYLLCLNLLELVLAASGKQGAETLTR